MPKPVVTVTTVRKLTPTQLKEVKQTLQQKMGEFTLQNKVDSNILGGLKIQLGDQEFDASLSGKLQRLQSQLAEVRVVTVIPLSAAQRKKIETAIKNSFGNVNIREELDPQILGGIKIITNSKEYDGSIQGKLERLKSQMLAKI